MTKITPPDKILQDHAQMLALQSAAPKPEKVQRHGFTTVTGIMATTALRKCSDVLSGLDFESLDGVNIVRPKIVTPMRIHRYHHS